MKLSELIGEMGEVNYCNFREKDNFSISLIEKAVVSDPKFTYKILDINRFNAKSSEYRVFLDVYADPRRYPTRDEIIEVVTNNKEELVRFGFIDDLETGALSD